MLGIPYQGSKRKLSESIIQHIISHNPKCTHIFDLFGGGGAISMQALKRELNVHYNELNSGVCNLLRKIQSDGVTPDFFVWVSREQFNENKYRDDWYGGLIKCCWSFGNNQKSYLFGKDVEPIKKAAHYYLIQNGYDFTQEMRVRLIKQFKKDSGIIERFELQQLERLEQLEQLEQLQRLEITNLSYEQVKINTPIESTIIYCDPPYKGTATYQSGMGFDYEAFYDWVNDNPYKVYISEYSAPFNEVKSFVHRCTNSASANNKVIEKLFCNQTEKIKTTLF